MPRKGVRKGARRASTAQKDAVVWMRDDGQSYAVVTIMLGNGRLRARCEDGEIKMCKIRGAMRRSQWISVGDIILVGLRDFQDEKADVLHVYPHDEVRRLKKSGELDALRLEGTLRDDDDEEELVVFELQEGELDLENV